MREKVTSNLISLGIVNSRYKFRTYTKSWEKFDRKIPRRDSINSFGVTIS